LLAFDATAARAFGRVVASLRRSGRKPEARASDALIAATAIAHDLPLYTCHPDDLIGRRRQGGHEPTS
jgi:predicted nucleic acid-binding protein